MNALAANDPRPALPTARDEDWKYAPLRALTRRDWWAAPGESVTFPDDEAVAAATLPGGESALVFAGGHAVPRAGGGFGALPAGVTLRPATGRGLRTPEGTAADRIALIANDTSPGAWEISVAAGVDAGTLHLVHLPAPGAGALVLRVLLGKGARLELVESLTAPADAATPALARWLDVQLAESSQLTHVAVQWLPPDAALLEQVDVEVGRDAAYHALPFTLGAQAARTTARIVLGAPGASARWDALLHVDGQRHADTQLEIRHAAPQTTSEQGVRALADGRGRGAFTGKVVMPAGAHGAASAQSIRNLLLGPGAELDTRPQLEIHVDDVKASHGTTTGTLDAQQLFYLRSRGLDESTARGLLTFAFAADVFARVRAPALRQWLAARIAGRLPDAELLKELAT